MLKRLISEKIFCGLDIGSQRIKVGIVKVKDPKNIELLGVFENRTHGFRDGSVHDLGEMSEAIHFAINDLSTRVGVKIKEVQLGVSTELTDVRRIEAVIPLADRGSKVIILRDVNKVNEQARLLGTKMDEEVLHELPQCYQVDDINTALNPLGLMGRKLAVQGMIIFANVHRIRNVVQAVNHAGYDVANFFHSSYVSAESVLTDEERMQGSVLVDIGSKVTGILIFKDGVLKYLDKIAIGGDDFTRAIAEKLNLSFDFADELKKSYAVALASDHQQNEDILVKREDAYIPIKRSAVYSSIEGHIVELVKSIQTSIRKSHLTEQINKGIVTIGGGAMLPGLIERIAQEVNRPARLGNLVNISVQKTLTNTSLFAPVIGLAMNGYRKSLGRSLIPNKQSNWWQGVTNRVNEIYQEYF